MSEGERCPESPRSSCAGCSCRVSLAMNPPYEPDVKQGYRCTDCELAFCVVCIKSDKHTSKWKAPCRDDELETWAQAIEEAPRLREAIAAAQLENKALRRVVEAAQPIVRWTADNYGDGVCDELDHWDLAVAALDALRSGKPPEEAAQTEPDGAACRGTRLR